MPFRSMWNMKLYPAEKLLIGLVIGIYVALPTLFIGFLWWIDF